MENQRLEYKDYSKIQNNTISLKRVKAKLFREISAFANSGGGRIIVGVEDNSLKHIPQPQYIVNMLENESLSQWVNGLSNGLIELSSNVVNNIIYINVKESVDVIETEKDYANVLKRGTVYHRINDSSEIADSKTVQSILVKKRRIVIGNREKTLRKIVHYKFGHKLNDTANINIFDSVFVPLSDPKKESLFTEANSMFEVIITNELLFNYSFPRTQEYTMQYANMITTDLYKSGRRHDENIISLYNKFPKMQRDFFKASKRKLLNSIELDEYIREFTEVMNNDK